MSVFNRLYHFVVHVVAGQCSTCGANPEGAYGWHGTFGYAKACCVRASGG